MGKGTDFVLLRTSRETSEFWPTPVGQTRCGGRLWARASAPSPAVSGSTQPATLRETAKQVPAFGVGNISSDDGAVLLGAIFPGGFDECIAEAVSIKSAAAVAVHCS